MDYIEKFFQAIHLAPRHLFGMGVLGLFLLFASSNVLSIFGIETIVNDYRVAPEKPQKSLDSGLS